MVTIVAGDGVTLLTDEDTTVSGSAAAIGDPGDTLSYGVTRNPANGSVAGDAATGAFTYTPAADFFGSDRFDVMVVDGHGGSDTLRVEVTVAAVNDAPRPTSATPATATGNEEAAITATVAMTDPEGNRMTYRILDAAKNGRVNIDQNGTYTYIGNRDFFGEDTFTVLVTDALGASTEVPVTVRVDNVQDAPRFVAGASVALSVTTGITSNRTLLAIDPDGDVVTYHVGSIHPEHGDLGIDPQRGTISYTPEDGFIGADQFTVVATDASGTTSALTVNVTVKPLPRLISMSDLFFDSSTAFFLHRILQYEGYQVDEYLGGGPGGDFGPGGIEAILPVSDYTIVSLPAVTSTQPFTIPDISSGDSRTYFNVAGAGFGMDGDGNAIPPATGSGTTTYSASMFGVSIASAISATMSAGAHPPPPMSFDEFVDGRHYFEYPVGDTFEDAYQAYVADNADGIFSDVTETRSGDHSFYFDVARGDVLADDPVLYQFLSTAYGRFYTQQSPDPDVVLAADAPQTVAPEGAHSYAGTSGLEGGVTRLEYTTIRSTNLPRVTVTPVGGSFEDGDGDGDFDFDGEVNIGLRNVEDRMLRLTGAHVELDPSVLHVTGATVYAAISEGAGLHDALFKGSFDIDRFTAEVLSFSAEAPPEGDANPYYAPGGLALTYSGFKLDFDGVDAFAKMAMPVPLFDAVNLDLADLTGFLDNGGFTFGRDHYGLAGGSVTFGGIEADFFGLFQAEAEELTLTYNNTTDEFSIDGELKITSPILELIPGAEEPELTFSGMKLKDGNFSFDGELAIEELKLPGGFGLSDVALALTLTDNVVTAFSGETHVTFGDGKPEAIFGIGFQRPPLSFDKITLGVDSLGVHLGDGVFLEKIQGDLEHLADVPPETAPGIATTFTGTLGLGWGPEIAEFELPDFLGGAEVGGGRIANLEITGTMDFENTFSEAITLNFLSDNLIKMTGSATIDLGQSTFSGLLSYDVLDGIATGQMLTVSNGHGITAHGNQTITAPSLMEWGPLSGATGLAADAFLSISTDMPSQSFFAAWTTFNNLPIVGSLTVGFKVDAANGFSLIRGGNDIPKTNSFDVDGNEDWLLITASWENETAGHVLTQVRTPENTFIQEADYAANGITLVPDLTSPFKTAIVIDNPRAGNWDLQVIQPGVGAVQYHGISPNPAETFAFNEIATSPGDISVSLGGLLAGAPAGATVSFFYDTDDTGFDGSIIGTGTVNALGEVSTTWNLAGTPGGDYHVYAVAFDGMNAPSMVYSDDVVHVALAPTDITVNDRASALGSPDLSIREDTRPGAVIARLGLVDPDFGGAATFTLLDDAGGRLKISGNTLVLTDRAFLDVDGTVGSGSAPALTASALGLPDYVITVQATDSEGFSITRDIQIDVTDLLGDAGYVTGTEGGDYLYGSLNIFVGRGGDDDITGNDGLDIAVFGGFRRNYSIEATSGGGGNVELGTAETPSVLIRDLRPGSPDGEDHLTGIEVYRFFDGDFTFADLANSPNTTIAITELDPLSEDTAIGTLVATVDVENPLPGEVYTLALVDDAAGLFRLEGDQVLLNGALDFETTQQYTLTVRATDTFGTEYEENLVVDVSDVDESSPDPGDATGTPVIVGTIAEGQTLTVDVSSVSDPDGIQLIGYQWQRSTDGGATFTDATGFFSPDPSYTVQGADVGALLRVLVAVQDVNGSFSAVSSAPTAPVITSNHEPTGIPLIEGSTVFGLTLTADISGIADADGIPPNVSYTWIRVEGGSEQAVGFEETYQLQNGDIGARLKVIVSYQDGGGISESLESALTNPVTLLPDDEFSRLEFGTGGGTIQENLFGATVGTILLDGLDNPSFTYTVFDPFGLFEMDGNVLKLKNGAALDFEAGGASRQIVVGVFDGDTPVYGNIMTVTVLDQPATLGSAVHELIPDTTVYDDVHGLIGLGGGPDGLTTPQWVNETRQDNTQFFDAGPIEVEFAATRDSFTSFRGDFQQGFNDDQKDAARAIFALVSSLTGVDFVETPFSTQPHIRMAIGTLTAGIGGIANGIGGDELLVGSVATNGDPTLLGSDFHLTLMHELGHTLGLDHGSNSGFADELPHIPLTHDRSAYSVMIQNLADGTPQSYMMADIATLQFLYGADFNFNGGDTVYTWSGTTGETFVDGVSMGLPVSNYILMTVWDGGGNDTYDASNYDDGVEIDLRPGEFSTLSVAQLGSASALGNVGNAYLHYDDNRSLIEHAIGGDGNDALTGNTGNNRLKGNGGDDTIDGQGGAGDIAVYDGGRTNYSLELLGNGDILVTDLRDGSPDGTDTVREIEIFEFDGFQLSVPDVLNNPPTGAVVIVGELLVGETLTLDTSTIADTEVVATPFTFQWARVRAGAVQIVGTGDSYTLTAADEGARIKATVLYQDGEARDEEISSALTAPAAAFPGQEFPRLELAQGGGTIRENIFDGQPVSILLFDGLMNEDLTYTITSDPSGAFELDGVMLRLKLGVGLDFEAAALRQVEITVADGTGLNYAQTMTVQVLDELPTLGTAAHAPISDPTVAADVAGLLNDASADGISQWVNETASDGTKSWGPAALEVFFADATVAAGSPLFIRELDADEKDAARAVFSLISTYAAVTLVEGAGPPSDNILGLAIGSVSIAFDTPSNSAFIGAIEADDAAGSGSGSPFRVALLRQLGHMLGLENGHNGRGTDFPNGDPLPHLPLDHDRSAYSAMTANATDGTPQTFMMADIATLQYLYGADFTTNSGDTVYTWSATTGETFINGASTGGTAANHILMTVWDGGGADTYDASSYGGGVEIDLRPGEFSTLSAAQLGSASALGNVGNAYLYDGDTRSLIENAIGGEGADTLKGNSADNRLTGGGGADDIDGGDGTDTAAFSGAHTDYVAVLLANGDIRITDLRAGAPDGVDTVRNVESFAFLDGTFAAAALVNDPPAVTGPVTLAPIAEDSNARLITQAELLANASDVDGPALAAINLAIAAGRGTLLDNNDGTWSYTPAADDDTAVSFSYAVSDGFAPAVAASATLDITPVSDAPPITPGTPGDDSFTAPAGPSQFDVGLGSDTITFSFALTDASFEWSGNQVTVHTATSHTVLTGFETFVFADGTVHNRDGNALVDDLFYYARNHDVWAAHVEADLHYAQQGWQEGRDPNAFFSTQTYLAMNPDVKAAGVNPLAHFDQSGWREGRIPSFDFDPAKYLGANPDVAAANVDPLAHFLQSGAEEGRLPFPVTASAAPLGPHGFDAFYYLLVNPDVAAAGVDPFWHFQAIGWQEGRDPNALFDTRGYLSAYTDVQAAGINPLDHYDAVGWREGRDPSGAFDTATYLSQNPDVAAAQINPLTHYLQTGAGEGRTAFNDGLFAFSA